MNRPYDAFEKARVDPAQPVTVDEVAQRCDEAATLIFAQQPFPYHAAHLAVGALSRTCNAVAMRDAPVLGRMHPDDRARIDTLTTETLDVIYHGDTDLIDAQVHAASRSVRMPGAEQLELARMRHAFAGFQPVVEQGPRRDGAPHGYQPDREAKVRDLSSRCAMAVGAVVFTFGRAWRYPGNDQQFLRGVIADMRLITSTSRTPRPDQLAPAETHD